MISTTRNPYSANTLEPYGTHVRSKILRQKNTMRQIRNTTNSMSVLDQPIDEVSSTSDTYQMTATRSVRDHHHDDFSYQIEEPKARKVHHKKNAAAPIRHTSEHSEQKLFSKEGSEKPAFNQQNKVLHQQSQTDLNPLSENLYLYVFYMDSIEFCEPSLAGVLFDFRTNWVADSGRIASPLFQFDGNMNCANVDIDWFSYLEVSTNTHHSSILYLYLTYGSTEENLASGSFNLAKFGTSDIFRKCTLELFTTAGVFAKANAFIAAQPRWVLIGRELFERKIDSRAGLVANWLDVDSDHQSRYLEQFVIEELRNRNNKFSLHRISECLDEDGLNQSIISLSERPVYEQLSPNLSSFHKQNNEVSSPFFKSHAVAKSDKFVELSSQKAPQKSSRQNMKTAAEALNQIDEFPLQQPRSNSGGKVYSRYLNEQSISQEELNVVGQDNVKPYHKANEYASNDSPGSSRSSPIQAIDHYFESTLPQSKSLITADYKSNVKTKRRLNERNQHVDIGSPHVSTTTHDTCLTSRLDDFNMSSGGEHCVERANKYNNDESKKWNSLYEVSHKEGIDLSKIPKKGQKELQANRTQGSSAVVKNFQKESNMNLHKLIDTTVADNASENKLNTLEGKNATELFSSNEKLRGPSNVSDPVSQRDDMQLLKKALREYMPVLKGLLLELEDVQLPTTDTLKNNESTISKKPNFQATDVNVGSNDGVYDNECGGKQKVLDDVLVNDAGLRRTEFSKESDDKGIFEFSHCSVMQLSVSPRKSLRTVKKVRRAEKQTQSPQNSKKSPHALLGDNNQPFASKNYGEIESIDKMSKDCPRSETEDVAITSHSSDQSSKSNNYNNSTDLKYDAYTESMTQGKEATKLYEVRQLNDKSNHIRGQYGQTNKLLRNDSTQTSPKPSKRIIQEIQSRAVQPSISSQSYESIITTTSNTSVPSQPLKEPSTPTHPSTCASPMKGFTQNNIPSFNLPLASSVGQKPSARSSSHSEISQIGRSCYSKQHTRMQQSDKPIPPLPRRRKNLFDDQGN